MAPQDLKNTAVYKVRPRGVNTIRILPLPSVHEEFARVRIDTHYPNRTKHRSILQHVDQNTTESAAPTTE